MRKSGLIMVLDRRTMMVGSMAMLLAQHGLNAQSNTAKAAGAQSTPQLPHADQHKGPKNMTLKLQSFGNMLVFPGAGQRHQGPLAIRFATKIGGIEWRTEILGDVSMEVGMGSYLQGPHGAHVNVRLGLKAGDGTPFFFQYISVGEMESHIRGETPVMLAGQIEIDPENEKYAWLNHVQLVGRGILSEDPLCQSYEMAYLAG